MKWVNFSYLILCLLTFQSLNSFPKFPTIISCMLVGVDQYFIFFIQLSTFESKCNMEKEWISLQACNSMDFTLSFEAMILHRGEYSDPGGVWGLHPHQPFIPGVAWKGPSLQGSFQVEPGMMACVYNWIYSDLITWCQLMKLCTQFWPINDGVVNLHCCTCNSCVISCTTVILGCIPHWPIDIEGDHHWYI